MAAFNFLVSVMLSKIHKEDIHKLKKAGYKPITPYILDCYMHDNKLTKPEFVENLMLNFVKEFRTITKSGKLICKPNKYRSLGNLFLITVNYYPKTRLSEVKSLLLSLNEKLVGHKCHEIDRRVYEHIENNPTWNQLGCGKVDEFGEEIYYYNSKGKKVTQSIYN